MLKRIKVRNFLSLENVQLDLQARNTFVGPNMAGKSNLIECLLFLQQAIRRRKRPEVSAFQQAVADRGGFADLVWQGQTARTISIEVVADLKDLPAETKGSYSYSISFGFGQCQWVEIQAERLLVERRGKRETLLERSHEGLNVSNSGNGASKDPNRPYDLALELFSERTPALKAFTDFILGWKKYDLIPALMRTANLPTWETNLSQYGENLSSWLLSLQNHPKEFQIFKQTALDTLPGLTGIIFQPVEPPRSAPDLQTGLSFSTEGSRISVAASETHFRKPIRLTRMSDGELVFLALLSLILAPAELRPSLLCIEEPENHLHPYLLEILVSLLDNRSTVGELPQLIMTTHSPLLVDKLSLDELVVTDRVDGATKFKRASAKKRLKEVLASKELSLGDLWYSGALSDS